MFAIDSEDNEMITLDIMDLFVNAIDLFFGNACEIDILFGFYHVNMLLDQMILTGELFETDVRKIIESLVYQHKYIEVMELEMACQL